MFKAIAIQERQQKEKLANYLRAISIDPDAIWFGKKTLFRWVAKFSVFPKYLTNSLSCADSWSESVFLRD